MTVSVIMTVRNEADSVALLLDSLLAQTLPPDEIVVCDGGSTDGTVGIVSGYAAERTPPCASSRRRAPTSRKDATWPLPQRPVTSSPPPMPACVSSRTGCSNWCSRWPSQTAARTTDVASGFFVADAHGVFETAMGATVLPPAADIKPEAFLPSSRSVAYSRAAWAAVGGYPEWLDYCEDLVFDLALQASRLPLHLRARRRRLLPPTLQPEAPSSGSTTATPAATARPTCSASATPSDTSCTWLPLLPSCSLCAITWASSGLCCWSARPGLLPAPWQRLWPQVRTWRLLDKMRAMALVPVIRLVGDVAKMAGYPAGVLVATAAPAQQG